MMYNQLTRTRPWTTSEWVEWFKEDKQYTKVNDDNRIIGYYETSGVEEGLVFLHDGTQISTDLFVKYYRDRNGETFYE